MEHERHPERPRDSRNREFQAAREDQISQGIESALKEGRDIDVATARQIALMLAAGQSGALAEYARSGNSLNRELREEYLAIYHDLGTSRHIREAIDWLGAHLVKKENASTKRPHQPPGAPLLQNLLWRTSLGHEADGLLVGVRADMPNEIVDSLPERLIPMLNRHGEAFRAFLLLDDVEATANNIEEAFTDSFVGVYSSRDDVIHGFTEVDGFAEALAYIRRQFIGGEFVDLDMDGLWNELREVWDITILNGEFYVFAR